jgi:Sulfotransferase family
LFRRRPAPFIVGVGRSGTTLLRLMLDAHPDLAIPPETGFLLPFFASGQDRPTREEFLRQVTGFHTFPDAGLSAERFGRELARLRWFSLARGTRLFYRLYAERHGKRRWGDKTPVYGQHLPAIRRLLPEARFLHLIRDGRDVALSLRERWFAPSRDASDLARHWRDQVAATRAAGARDLHYLEVRYEDLIFATRPTLERVAGFLDLPFRAEMERYTETARLRLAEVQDQRRPDGSVITREQRMAQHPFLHLPPQPARMERWRREMTAAEQESFAAEAGDLLRELGYPSS